METKKNAKRKTKSEKPKYAHRQITEFMEFLKEEKNEVVSGAMGSGSSWNHGLSEEAKHIFREAKKIFKVK